MLYGRFAVRHLAPSIAELSADHAWPETAVGGDPADVGTGSQPEDGDAPLDDGAGPDPHGSAADDPDDEDFDIADEDDAGNRLDSDTRLKKVAAALKKAKRKLGTSRAVRQQLKELQEQGMTLNDLVYQSRQYREFQESASKNPAVRKLFSPGGDEEPPRPPAEPEFQFDEAALGFDPNLNPANRAIADGLRRGARAEFMLERLMKGLNPAEVMGRLQRLEGHTVASVRQSVDQEWDGSIRAAAEELVDEGVRQMFVDAMLTAKGNFGGKGRPAKFFVDHYLSKLKVGRAEKKAATAAADASTARPGAAQQQRGAERVASLPRFAGLQSTPAPARKTRENLADVRRRLTGQRPRQPSGA